MFKRLKIFLLAVPAHKKTGRASLLPLFIFFRYISGYFCFASFFVMPQVLASMKKIRRMPT